MIKQIPVDWQWSTQLHMQCVSDKTEAAAYYLSNDLGLQPGDPLAICLNNSESLIAVIYAAFRLGITMYFYNPHLNSDTLNAQLTLTPCKHCLSDKTLSWHGSTFVLPTFSSSQHCNIDAYPLPAQEHIAFAIPSSGSSGTSKHILLSYRAILESAWRCNQHLGMTSSDHWLVCLPLFHVGGLSILFRAAVNKARLSIVPTFDAAVISQLLLTDQVSCMSLVPTMLKRLLAHRQHTAWPQHLRYLIIGGARSHAPDLEHSAQLGCRPVCSYGLSEFASQVATQQAPTTHNASCGQLINGLEISFDDQQRISLRGPCAFSGYFMDGMRSYTHTADTWFATQDRGAFNENGELCIFGRSDDIIIRGGENISLHAIEDRIEALEICDALCVVAQDHDEWGQVPALCYQGPLNESAMQQQICTQLDSILQPFVYKRVTCLPTLANGKIDRQNIIAEFDEKL